MFTGLITITLQQYVGLPVGAQRCQWCVSLIVDAHGLACSVFNKVRWVKGLLGECLPSKGSGASSSGAEVKPVLCVWECLRMATGVVCLCKVSSVYRSRNAFSLLDENS